MKPGIHQITMSEYLALKALSSGLCHALLTSSPFHAKYEQDNGSFDDTDASDMGTAIHDALLEGIDRIAVIEADDWRTKAAKEARDAARAAGKIPMLARKVAQVEAAAKEARDFIDGKSGHKPSEIAGVFDGGKPEQTLIWKEGDILCKARPDWLTEDRSIMLHVKTTAGSAEPSSWIRNQLAPMGYDVAAEFYDRGLATIAGTHSGSECLTVFLVIEQNAPHGCSLVSLSPAMQDLASRKVDRAIRIWQECQASGRYPCYPSRICYAEPQNWQLIEAEGWATEDQYDQKQMEHGLQP